MVGVETGDTGDGEEEVRTHPLSPPSLLVQRGGFLLLVDGLMHEIDNDFGDHRPIIQHFLVSEAHHFKALLPHMLSSY